MTQIAPKGAHNLPAQITKLVWRAETLRVLNDAVIRRAPDHHRGTGRDRKDVDMERPAGHIYRARVVSNWIRLTDSEPNVRIPKRLARLSSRASVGLRNTDEFSRHERACGALHDDLVSWPMG